MKKKFLILVPLCIAYFSQAQVQKTQILLWENVGGSYSSLYQSSNKTSESHGIIGPELGISVRMESPAYWGFEAGAYYAGRGVKFTDKNTTVTLKYAGFFVNGLLFFPLKNNDNIYVGAGLYAANALVGKSKRDSTITMITFGETWKKLDAGIQLRAAYTIKNTVALGLHYDIGMLRTYNITNLREEPSYGKNLVFSIFASTRLASLLKK